MPIQTLIRSLAHSLPTPIKAGGAIGLVCTVALFTGCSRNTELEAANQKLDQANKRIAALEAQLPPSQLAMASTTNTSAPRESAPGEIISTSGIPRGPEDRQRSAPGETTSTAGMPQAVATEEQWSYTASEAQMTGGTRYVASVESTNTVNFRFPYDGTQHGRLILRTDPQHGKDVMFRLEKGQILCLSYESCTVQVRFDDEKPSSFSATGPADRSSEVVFLNDYSRFLAKMRKAKRVRIAVNLYQQGSPVFEFDVSGFDAKRYQSGS